MPGRVQLVKPASEQLLNVIAFFAVTPLPIATTASPATIQVSMPLLGSLSLSSTCGTTYGPTPVVACANSLPDTQHEPQDPDEVYFPTIDVHDFCRIAW